MAWRQNTWRTSVGLYNAVYFRDNFFMFFALNLVFLTNNNASTSSCCIVVFCLSLCCYENKNYFTVEPQGAVMGKGLGRL